MVWVLIVAIGGVLGMLLCLAFKNELKVGRLSFQTYYFAPLLAAVILLATGLEDFGTYWTGLTSPGAINPLEILVLFLSMAFLSTVLDEAGFFAYLASKTVQKAKGSQFKVFILLYLLTSLLTVFTSNDIIILTFTPFLIYFSKRAKVDPIPYLVGEFVAANSWSMLFLIGNPTNIYLSESFGVTFLQYFLAMWPSAVAGGLVSFGVMILLFYKKLSVPFTGQTEIEPIKDKFLMIGSLVALGGCLVVMVLADFFAIPLWLVSAISAGALLVYAFVYVLVKRKEAPLLGHSLKRLPYSVIPFVLSMFAIVLALKEVGLTKELGLALNSIDPIWSYGLSSFLGANLVNNIPMSVLYTEVIRDGGASLNAVYASVISSNLGAFLTPVGALAGVMWMSILKHNEVKYSFFDFVKYGTLVALPALGAALACLYLPF
jgi:arsenical pump membrane protein